MGIMMTAERVLANQYRVQCKMEITITGHVLANQYRNLLHNQLKIGATKTQEVDQVQTIHRPYRDQGLQKALVNVALDVLRKDQKDLEQDNDNRIK